MVELEYERARYVILASGNPKLYDALFGRDDDEDEFENVKWTTPKSREELEELEQVLLGLDTIQEGSQTFEPEP